jgi:hypothetical protein
MESRFTSPPSPPASGVGATPAGPSSLPQPEISKKVNTKTIIDVVVKNFFILRLHNSFLFDVLF